MSINKIVSQNGTSWNLQLYFQILGAGKSKTSNTNPGYNIQESSYREHLPRLQCPTQQSS